MSRRNREDEPGALLHLWGRGLGKRPVFENIDDVRFFESRLAREQRRDRLRVHAFVLLLNHYHLFVSSPRGRLSEAMRVILNEYVRWFNRRRRRDGPLFRSRFGSRPVRSEGYLWTLIRYIDLHSEGARIVADAGLYPFGSAYHYLTEQGPRWLARDLIEGMLAEGQGAYSPEMYQRVLARPLSVAERELVDLRMRGVRCPAGDPLDDLVRAGPAGVRDWIIRKAANADGTTPGIALASPSDLLTRLEAARTLDPDWHVGIARGQRDAWQVMAPGLLRDACRLSHAEVGARLGLATTCAQGRWGAHRRFLVEDAEYAERVSELIADSLLAFGRPGQSVDGGESGGLVWTPPSTLVLP